MKRNTKLNKRKYFFVLFFVCLLVLIVYNLPRLGTWLVRQDKLEKADAIVVLMGNIPDRVLETYDVYHEAYADTIIIVMANRYGIKVFRKTGIFLDGQTSISKKALTAMGVPKRQIVILPGDAKSTFEEAAAVKDYLRKNKRIDTLILITSSYHTRRATLIFNDVFSGLENKVTIISRASKYTGFDAENWWKKRETKKVVLYEYLKLLNFYLFDRYNYQLDN